MRIKTDHHLGVSVLASVLAACGATARPVRTVIAPLPAQSAALSAPSAREEVAVQVREQDRHRALFQREFGFEPFEGVTVWARAENDVLLAAYTNVERNSAPAAFWLRLNGAGEVKGKGELAMAYPRAMKLVDVTGDGAPEIVLFGTEFTGANPYSPTSVRVFTRAQDTGEPEELKRATAALTSEFDASLEAQMQAHPSPEPLTPLPDDAAMQRAVLRADAFVPPNEPASMGLFTLGLQLATNTQLRDAIGPRGLKLCKKHEEWEYTACRTLSARQLTDAVLDTRVRPLLGRTPVTRRSPALEGTPMWSDILLFVANVRFWSESSSEMVTCVIEHTDTRNRLVAIVTP